MKNSIGVSVTLVCLLNCVVWATARAQDPPEDSSANERDDLTYGSLDDPDDPQELLRAIRERGAQRESIFPVSPLVGLHDFTDKAKQDLYESTGLTLGLAFNHLFQWYSDSLPGADDWGTASDLDIVGTWELVDRGKPTQGQVVFGIEGRWDYGTTGPTDLSVPGLGSLNFPANAYAAYVPTFLPIRNLYWQQGSEEAGWAYRVGYITPDQILSTSGHLSPTTTFLSIIGTGSFSNGLPDSGLGVAGAWYINDRMKLLGVVSDSNANRQDFGDIGEGDFYKGIDFAFKVAPKTPKAGYSKLSLWHSDGTSDGKAINGSTGRDGWGFVYKHEQELTADGRAIGILKYGKSFDDSALYEQQAGASFLLYEPLGQSLKNDLFGVAFNWGDATDGVRDEYTFETFYRFPVFPLVDMTLSYQWVIDPALDLGIDNASVFSLRVRTTF